MADDTLPPEKNPIRLVLAFVMVGLGLWALLNGYSSLTDNQTRLLAPDGTITIEIVESQEDRVRGLSGRETIGDDRGMLFVFDASSIDNCFWMKDMQFAIDMVWLDEQRRVVTVTENVPPDSYPESFCPTVDAKYGLEIGSGKAEKLGIEQEEFLRF